MTGWVEQNSEIFNDEQSRTLNWPLATTNVESVVSLTNTLRTNARQCVFTTMSSNEWRIHGRVITIGFAPLSGRSQHDRASLTIVHGHRARVVHQVHARVPAVAHDELLAADRAGRFARHATVQVFDHVVRGVQVFAFHPAPGRPAVNKTTLLSYDTHTQ